MQRLLVFGNGYTGRAIATHAAARGWDVTLTSRKPADPLPGVRLTAFDAAPAAEATHVISTVPPDPTKGHRDPVLALHGPVLVANPALRWAGYLSTTGVYGDRGGAWVDEDTPPAPTGPRGAVRVAREQAWAALGNRAAIDLFRVAGIYGPGRSPLNDVRAGTARRIVKPGHAFGRIHRDDIVQAVLAAGAQDRSPGVRVLHLNDDEPAENAAVIEEAARLLGAASAARRAVRTGRPAHEPRWAAASGRRTARSPAARPRRPSESPGATRPIATAYAPSSSRSAARRPP